MWNCGRGSNQDYCNDFEYDQLTISMALGKDSGMLILCVETDDDGGV